MAVPFARDRLFWRRMGRAVVIGALAGLAILAFTQVVRWGTDLIWPEADDYGLMEGEWWWVAVLGITGLLVGILRVALRVPDELEGSLAIVQDAEINRSTALQAIAVSAVSLIGGASLGPFDGGIRSGAVIGDWYSSIRGLDDEERKVNTLIGVNGSLAGLLATPILATLFATELRWPEKRQYYRLLLPNLVAAVFGFSVTFAILGDTFLGVFLLPGYVVRFWHLGIAIVLGFVAALLSWLLGLTVFVLRRWAVPLITNSVLRATVGGLGLGLIAFAFPLTLASGKLQLGVAIQDATTLGAGLLVAVVFAKILAVAVSLSTGFIGGPVMPTLFIGGTAGLAIHVIFPDIPAALAFSAMLVAVPGVSIGAPFTMVFLASLMVGVGPVEAIPAAIAVLTAYTATQGLGWFKLPAIDTRVDIDDVSVQTQLFDVSDSGDQPESDT